ncbi:SpoIIE family protein phosphatase [Pseudonocardia sp. RS11V-5]|uniref:SpoIIE family protein phosphatase n=1 Tax=Pseudonocardia terrae TaxID=2905831 RepID=UPI001E300C77|nr:SpoIIE family protein phosphatase [Pseudonocardia terrae]MCE3554048.1 SpoIIE family protein phosphatase [Pseudonocardia terrae]
MTVPDGPGVRRLLATADESDSPLGAPGEWPAELSSAVDLMLASPHPLALFWGPRHHLVYNDAFAAVLADRHPRAFGRPGAEVWPEVWDHVGPALRHVLDTGQAVQQTDDRLVVDGSDGPRETFWRYAFSPVRAADGTVTGVFDVMSESTAQVVSARRTALLGRLAQLVRDAGPADPAAAQVVAALVDSPDVPFALIGGVGAPVAVGVDPTPGLVALLDREGLVTLPSGEKAWAAPLSGGVRLLLGATPLHPIDREHREFLALVAGHVDAALAAVRAAAEERERTGKLDSRDRSRTEFFTGVSHEFRTPLALIMGPLEQLRGADDPRVRHDADVAHRSAQRMLKLVNTLLDVSRLEEGHPDAGFAPVDLGTLTGELAALFRAPTERAGLRLDIDCPPSERPVWVDQDMWEKIVLNLLSNALKFTFEGGLRVSTRLEDDRFVLRVADTGTGVPAAELPRLFDRFHRVRAARARSHEGSGIGLALVRQLAEVHGGTVEAASTAGVGSTFTVRLPLGFVHLPVESITLGRPATTPHPRPETFEPFVAEALRWTPARPEDRGTPRLPESVDPPQGRVLVVEDDVDMREHLHGLLSENWSVHAVASGTEALDVARSDPPDLVVADVMMPELDGIGLLRALRAGARTAGLPVVLLSARAGEEAAVEGLAAGADDYLVKPFSARELLARVANHLHLGRVRRAAEHRFRAMANSTPALIWVDDAGGHRVFVNRGWLDFTGAREAVGELGLDWRERIHPDDRERYRSVVEAATRTGAPFEVEYRLRGGDGRFRWVLDRGAPVGATAGTDGGPAGRRVGYVGGCLDIDARHTEQRRHQLYAAVGDALDREISQSARLEAFARIVVDERLGDIVRVFTDDGAGPAMRIVAATDPDVERELRTLPGLPVLWELADVEEPVLLPPEKLAAAFAATPPEAQEVWRRSGAHSALLVPLRARGGMLGMFAVARTGASPVLDESDVALFAEIARRAAVAVDNARLLEQERASSTRLGLLHRATAEMSAAATPTEVARTATSHLVALLGSAVAGVWQTRGEDLQLLALQGWEGELPAELTTVSLTGDHPARTALRTRHALWFEDAGGLRDEHAPAAEWLAAFGIEAAFWVPLVAGDRDLGMIAVGFTGPRALTASDREATLAVAELAAQALDRSLLLVAETEGRRLAERLGAVATALSRATDLESVADVILAHARSALGAEAVVVLLVDDEGLLHTLAADGWSTDGRIVEHGLRVTSDHPLGQVVRSAEPIWAAGGLPGPYPVRTAVPLLVAGRAIGVIGLGFGRDPAFGPDERGLVLTLASQCAQAVQRARLHQAEHEVAVTLQRSLLPQELPQLDRLAVATRYNPGTEGTEAGGDWFDVLDLADGRVALVVGDVVGRGPSAAAVMGQLRSALAANLVNGQPPATALEQLDLFARRVTGARASTVACAVVDTASGVLRYACAGHPAPLVAGPDGVRLLDGGRGTPLGVAGRPPFAEAEGRIEPGETILLCSDGLFERRTEVIDDGMERLAETFGALAAHRPSDVIDVLLERMLDAEGAPDDTVVVLARRVPEPLTRSMPADAECLAPMRRAIAEWAARCGLGEDGTTDLQLAVGEAVTNAVEHAYTSGGDPGADAVELTLELRPEGPVAVRVVDHGLWRPPPADPGYRGRGLALIRELAEEVEVLPADDGTEVWFRLPALPVEVVPRLPGGAADRPAGAAPVDGGPAVTRLRRWADRHTVRVHVDGDLDLAGVAAVRSDLLAELDGGGPLTLTLAADSYVSSSGIALLSELAQRARAGGTELSVVTPSDSPARRILVLAGLDTLIGVVPDA